MTLRKCDVCSAEYEAKTARSKFCSARCRVRNHERPRPPVPGPQVAAELPSFSPEVLERTKAELSAANRLDSALGRDALVLADRLDRSSGETGQALAALVRAHREALTEAVRGARVAADPVDELRARRDLKRTG